MEITYDPAKNSKNIAERGLSFDMVAQFDFDTADIYADVRKNYGEVRYVGLGCIKQRLHIRGVHRNSNWSACHQSTQSQRTRGKYI